MSKQKIHIRTSLRGKRFVAGKKSNKNNLWTTEDFTVNTKTYDKRIPYEIENKSKFKTGILANVFWEPNDVQMRVLITPDYENKQVAFVGGSGYGKPPSPEIFIRSLVLHLNRDWKIPKR